MASSSSSEERPELNIATSQTNLLNVPIESESRPRSDRESTPSSDSESETRAESKHPHDSVQEEQVEEDSTTEVGCWQAFSLLSWKDQVEKVSYGFSYFFQFWAVIFALALANTTEIAEIETWLLYTATLLVFFAVGTNGAIGFRMVSIIFSLFFFFISIDLIANGGQLIVGQGTNFFDPVNENPVAGLVVGIFITAVIQSSSTTTSIAVTLVGADILTLQGSIPVIMGANVGTSVTNTILAAGSLRGASAGHVKRVFGAATVHDFFNLLAVLFFFPLEIITRSPPGSKGYLEAVALGLGDLFFGESGGESFSSPFKAATKPLTEEIVVISKSKFANATSDLPFEGSLITGGAFADSGLSDAVSGILIAILGLVFLLVTLTVLVKSLSGLAKESTADIIKYSRKSPGVLNLILGAGLTMLVQSSSVITSIMVPLVGLRVMDINTMYPIALGANVGTTLTAMLAALVAAQRTALEASLAHFMFNVSGVFVFYLLPWCFYYIWKWSGEFFLFFPLQWPRLAPIKASEALAGFVAKKLWFGPLYIIITFFVVPGVLLGLSFGGIGVFFGIFVPVLVLTLAIVILALLKNKKPEWLPGFLQDLSWASDPIKEFWDDKFGEKWNSSTNWLESKTPNFILKELKSWTVAPLGSDEESDEEQQSGIELGEKVEDLP